MNRPTPNPTIAINNLPNLSAGKVWIGDGMMPSRPIEADLPLPDLLMDNIWIGDAMNHPIPNPTITIDNLPNLSSGKVWIGNGSIPSRPIEGSPPQGPAGPPGPAGKGDGQPNNLANSAVDGAAGSAVKFGLEQLFKNGANAVGNGLSTLTKAIIGVDAFVNTAISLADTVIDAVAVSKDRPTPYLDYRTTITNNSLLGMRGAQGLSGVSTLLIIGNVNLKGSRLEEISPSPGADYDAVPAKWVWDLLNDNVEIIWAN